MKMSYALKVLAIGRKNMVKISKKDFYQLLDSTETINIIGNILENYQVVVSAYEHLEDSIHKVALNELLYGFGGYETAIKRRVSLNSAIIAYLAAARYFLDSTNRLIQSEFISVSIETFKNQTSSLYDTNKEYKFIEALRNYVLHKQLPIDKLQFHNFIEDRKDFSNSDIVKTLSMYVKKDKLKKDKKFKKDALTEMPEEIDILFCIRSHMAGIWSLYDYLDKSVKNQSDKARSIIKKHIDSFKEIEDPLGLYAIEENSDGEVHRKIPLLLDWDDARINLNKNLGSLKRLPKLYISGKIKKEQ